MTPDEFPPIPEFLRRKPGDVRVPIDAPSIQDVPLRAVAPPSVPKKRRPIRGAARDLLAHEIRAAIRTGDVITWGELKTRLSRVPEAVLRSGLRRAMVVKLVRKSGRCRYERC